jgi:benzodiazapine receptor
METSTESPEHFMQRFIALAIFIVIVVLAVAVSTSFPGGEWYQAMSHPWWNPSAIVMASVWAVLYVLMAVSAWLVWDTLRSLIHVAFAWWTLQLVTGVAWPWLFFGMHRIGWAIAVMGFWLLLVLITAKSFRSIRPAASSLMLPLAIWLLFTLVLNFIQWRLNDGGLQSIL